ncbi:hypothetical protein EJ110_NYTH24792 [Nymphaea thermarum]|nr:hypothetical protein EJ110_NYTH24792 [Nymphaea thermarum]
MGNCCSDRVGTGAGETGGSGGAVANNAVDYFFRGRGALFADGDSLAKLKEALCLYLLQAQRYCAMSSQGPALGSTVSSSCCSSSSAGRRFTNYEPNCRHNFSTGDWRVCCTVQPRLAGGRGILQLPEGVGLRWKKSSITNLIS